MSKDVPAPPKRGLYYPDSVIIYGVKLNNGKDPVSKDFARFWAGPGYELWVQLWKSAPLSAEFYSVALAHGYGYDGHCYRFDGLRVFIVTSPGEPPVGCEFDEMPIGAASANSAEFMMWRLRAASELLEITTSFGDAKSLILDANLPGRRSPSSYAINMAMGHRGGRLTQE